MKIVIDDRIPYIRETISKITNSAVYIKGTEIAAEDVKDADAMIVRTRTRCNERLLSGSSVKFIATATIGYDHLDTGYLAKAGIKWTNCPGCNAGSVAQYLRSTLVLLSREQGLDLSKSTIGIVGCGHVGSMVKVVAEQLGMRVLVNDPLVGAADYVSLGDIERKADVITFHVPMTTYGPYATYHLADSGFFDRVCRRPFIINTSRGGVVDNNALKDALKDGKIRQAAIDTWENEPNIDLELLNNVYIGTPHVAGYSADGKVNADNMAVAALCNFFGIENPGRIVPPALPSDFIYTGDCLQLYNPLNDSDKLKSEPDKFEELRGNYPLRRETYKK